MAKANQMADPKLIDSPLSRTVTVDGEPLQICIYRLEHQSTWTLEIVDRENTSTVWENEFPSDEAALAEAFEAIKDEGLEAFKMRTIH